MYNRYTFTVLWTPPEVLAGQDYNSKVDIWSFGCVIIEMASAKLPWQECNFKNPMVRGWGTKGYFLSVS